VATQFEWGPPLPQGETGPTSRIRTQPDFVHYSSMEALAGTERSSTSAERVARCEETSDALHEYGSVSNGLVLRGEALGPLGERRETQVFNLPFRNGSPDQNGAACCDPFDHGAS